MSQPPQPPPAPQHHDIVNRSVSPVPGFNPHGTEDAASGNAPNPNSGPHQNPNTLHIVPTSTSEGRAPSSTPHPPPAPSHHEHINMPVPPVPGFNLSTSLHDDTPSQAFNNMPPLESDHSNRDSNTEVSTTLNSYVDGEQVKEKTWKPEGRIRKKPMFDMPGDPVRDSEMSGVR
jgi:hypothetical protein